MNCSNVNFDYILIFLILIIIFWMHCQWIIDNHGYWLKIFIVLSFIIFVTIFVEHTLYCVLIDDKKYHSVSSENLQKLQNNNLINNNNRAIRLLINILTHPIFHII